VPATAKINALLTNPNLQSSNLELARQAQKEISKEVFEILKLLGIPTDVTKAMRSLTTDSAEKIVAALKQINTDLPASAEEDPYIRNLVLSIAYHLMRPKANHNPSKILRLNAAIDALKNSNCPGAPNLDQRLWDDAKQILAPWLANWSSKLTKNSNNVLSSAKLATQAQHHRSDQSIGRALVDNEATAFGNANGHFGGVRAGLSGTTTSEKGINPSLDFPIAFGQGYDKEQLLQGPMPSWHEIQNVFIQSTGINEYSLGLNVISANLPKNVKLSDLLKSKFAKSLAANASNIFNTLNALKSGLRSSTTSPKRWVLSEMKASEHSHTSVFEMLVQRGLSQVNHPRFADIRQFYKEVSQTSTSLTSAQNKLFKQREMQVIKWIFDMNQYNIPYQTKLMNRGLAIRYLLEKSAVNNFTRKGVSTDPKHLDVLLSNPPKDLLQISDSQFEQIVRAGGGEVRNKVWVGMLGN
jgi:hypothetical protein